MTESTKQLVQDFSIMGCEFSELGAAGVELKLPMPPANGPWNRSDPNTILRVYCVIGMIKL